MARCGGSDEGPSGIRFFVLGNSGFKVQGLGFSLRIGGGGGGESWLISQALRRHDHAEPGPGESPERGPRAARLRVIRWCRLLGLVRV